MALGLDLTMCTLGLVFLVLTVLLSVMCGQCGRHSFELRDTTPEKGPPALVRVVKLEETRESPITHKVKDFTDGKENLYIPQWKSHLGAPQAQDGPSEDIPGLPQWRRHLEAHLEGQ